MFEHLSNCHGEWNAVFAMLGSAPVLGLWFRAKFFETKKTSPHEAIDENR